MKSILLAFAVFVVQVNFLQSSQKYDDVQNAFASLVKNSSSASQSQASSLENEKFISFLGNATKNKSCIAQVEKHHVPIKIVENKEVDSDVLYIPLLSQAIAKDSRQEFCACLYDRKTDFNAQDSFGNTPLHYAAWIDSGNEVYVEMLLRRTGRHNVLHFDLSAENAEEETALDLAVYQGNMIIAARLLEALGRYSKYDEELQLARKNAKKLGKPTCCMFTT